MTKTRGSEGKAAEAYVWMRLLEHGMIPYVPLIDCEGIDILVRTRDDRCIRVQVKSRGYPTPEAYGHQIKGLYWDMAERELAFDYLAVVLPVAGQNCHEAWVVPVEAIHLSPGGDITLSERLLQEEWASYRECWNLDTSS